jgi:hypothetical protein
MLNCLRLFRRQTVLKSPVYTSHYKYRDVSVSCLKKSSQGQKQESYLKRNIIIAVPYVTVRRTSQTSVAVFYLMISNVPFMPTCYFNEKKLYDNFVVIFTLSLHYNFLSGKLHCGDLSWFIFH